MRTLLFLLPAILAAQAVPTEPDFLNFQFGNGMVDPTVDGQLPRIRRNLITHTFNTPVLGAHNLLMSVGYVSPSFTLQLINSYTDTLHASGVGWMEVNADADFFTTLGNDPTTIGRYQSAFVYAKNAPRSMSVKLNASWGAGQGQGGFTAHTCTSSPGLCSAGYFSTFANFQTPGIAAIVALVSAYGSPSVLGTALKGLTLTHEPNGLANTNLFAPGNRYINSTTCNTCPGSPTDWNNFATAAAAAIRAIGAGTCSTCSTTLKLSMATLGGGTDADEYFPVFVNNASLNEMCVDLYTPNTSALNSYLQTSVVPKIIAVAKAAGIQVSVEETNPPNWVPNNAPAGESVSYKGRGNNDWSLYDFDIQWLRALYMFVGERGMRRLVLFQSFPLIHYCTGTECGPDHCGNDGTQCLGDIPTQNPYIANTIAIMQANLDAGGAPLQTTLSKRFRQLVTSQIRGFF